MSINKYHNRAKMVHLFLEKNLSTSTKSEIAYLFKDIEENKKEDLAKKIIPLIETSKTEKGLVTEVKQLVNSKTMR